MSQTLTIDIDGTVRFVYSDSLVEYLDLGKSTVVRASHVEPNADGLWIADLGPSGGPQLGPFRLRQEALDAELEWLHENRGV
jgi:hypothetical protein